MSGRRSKPRNSGQQSKRWRKQQKALNRFLSRVYTLRTRRYRFIDVWMAGAP